jgi:tripartite-type tricarboxylate transporter receptor subunit TctC
MSAKLRTASIALVAVCLLLPAISPAGADDLPNKPIRIIVPLAAGSSLDSRARVIAQALGKRLKQQPMVENRPGAGSAIGAAYVAKSAPDGSTLLFTNDSVVINPHVYRDAGYDVIKDFVPVTQAYTAAMVLVVNPGVRASSVKQLIALARATPGGLTYGSSGNAGLPHLAMEVFAKGAGIEVLHVPYKGDAQALNDILGGRIPAMISGIPAALPQVQAGKLRALAVTTLGRISVLPDVPTVAESGLPGYDVGAWTGFFAPAGTPPAMVAALNGELVAALNTPEVKAHLVATGGTVVGNSPSQFSVFVQREFERYGKLVKEIGLKAD